MVSAVDPRQRESVGSSDGIGLLLPARINARTLKRASALQYCGQWERAERRDIGRIMSWCRRRVARLSALFPKREITICAQR